MTLKDIKNYVSRLQINCDKSNFYKEYTEIIVDVLSLYDDAIEAEPDSEICADWLGIIEEKFEQRWKVIFYREYNDSLKAFDGATCPIGGHILYWCYKQIPLLFLKDNEERFSDATDSMFDDLDKKWYRRQYNLVNKTPIDLFKSVTVVYDCDYFRNNENQWQEYLIEELFSCFSYKPLKRLCAEIMIEYIDVFRKCYAEYLPASFLDACADDKDFLVQVRDSLPN